MAICLGSTFVPQAALATAGTQRWVYYYQGPNDDWGEANAVAVSPDGSRVFVTGYGGAAAGEDYATVAYDASSGGQLWVKRYNGQGDANDQAQAVSVSPDGATVFVTGWSFGTSTSTDYATLAYDAATGTRLWLQRYAGPLLASDHAVGLGVSPDGSTVFVTGTTAYDDGTLAYDASTEDQLWVRFYNGPLDSREEAQALRVSPDGSRVFVTGSSVGSGTGLDYATVAYDASTGAKLWGTRYNGPGARSGAQRWVRRFSGPDDGEDIATALGVSPNGSRVFVTGNIPSPNGRIAATVAYRASTGAQRWLAKDASLW